MPPPPSARPRVDHGGRWTAYLSSQSSPPDAVHAYASASRASPINAHLPGPRLRVSVSGSAPQTPGSGSGRGRGPGPGRCEVRVGVRTALRPRRACPLCYVYVYLCVRCHVVMSFVTYRIAAAARSSVSRGAYVRRATYLGVEASSRRDEVEVTGALGEVERKCTAVGARVWRWRVWMRVS